VVRVGQVDGQGELLEAIGLDKPGGVAAATPEA